MYIALTVNDNIITGVHESSEPIHDGTFLKNPEYASDQVIAVAKHFDYRRGEDIRTYYKNGNQRSLVWRIEQGYEMLPEGAEIIDGVLVNKETPVEEAPPTIMRVLTQLEGKVAQLLRKTEELTGLSLEVAAINTRLQKVELTEPISEEEMPIKGSN